MVAGRRGTHTIISTGRAIHVVWRQIPGIAQVVLIFLGLSLSLAIGATLFGGGSTGRGAPRVQLAPRTQPVTQAAPSSEFDAAGFLAFAQVCGRYLRDGKVRQVTTLPAPTTQIQEYRDSMLLLIATFVLYSEGKRADGDVLRSYARYDRAVTPLGDLYTYLVREGCWPKTVLGDAYETIKRVARASR